MVNNRAFGHLNAKEKIKYIHKIGLTKANRADAALNASCEPDRINLSGNIIKTKRKEDG